MARHHEIIWTNDAWHLGHKIRYIENITICWSNTISEFTFTSNRYILYGNKHHINWDYYTYGSLRYKVAPDYTHGMIILKTRLHNSGNFNCDEIEMCIICKKINSVRNFYVWHDFVTEKTLRKLVLNVSDRISIYVLLLNGRSLHLVFTMQVIMHEDVLTWKHFPNNWPFHEGNPPVTYGRDSKRTQKASKRTFWWCICC